MLMNMKSNSKVGKAITETASIAYTGELLPAGTASYKGISIDATKRYLKNSGTDKTPALVESGQGKFFNGTSQYLNTGIIPNASQGTLVTRATLGDTSANRYIVGAGGSNANCSLAFDGGYLKFIFGSDFTLVSTGVLGVVGRSYHIALKHTGLTVRIYVDGVFVFSKDVTAFTPVNALGVGARWAGSAALYFNSVIDETYYYDVALTDAQIESLYKYPEKIKAYNGAIVPDIGSEDNCKLFLPMCENSGSNVYNVAVNPATSLALASYATTMHTSAAKLSYGAQCTAWKRDSLGVLLGMSKGMQFDGGKSVKGILTGWTPTNSDWAIECIVYMPSVIPNTYGKFIWAGSGKTLIQFNNSQVGYLSIYIQGASSQKSGISIGYHRIILCSDGRIIIDGVQSTVTPNLSTVHEAMWIGSSTDTNTTSQNTNNIPYVRVHKGSQYAKFDPVKADAKMVKIIAKLGE